jgi:hypothetical protein
MSHDASAPMYTSLSQSSTSTRSKAPAILFADDRSRRGHHRVVACRLLRCQQPLKLGTTFRLRTETGIRISGKICEFGPRPSGTPAIEKLQAYLIEHFESLGRK